ncbi:MAG: VWA domain-containing protein [Candidatus Diapherotrites archaeon]|nr:VWA domain-containing protein [Candidatus Diapherotrites archaeon]
MSIAQSTGKNSLKGFVFSIDAVLAVILVSSAILATQTSFFQYSHSSINVLAKSADDVFSTLQDTGFLFQETDRNSLDNAALSFYFKAKGLLPSNSGLQVRLSQYNLNKESCRQFKDFNNCFALAGEVIVGDAIDSNEIAFGKRLIVKKQSPGDCNISAQFSDLPLNQFPKEFGSAFFDTAFFASGGDLNIGVAASYNSLPLMSGSSIQCDENIHVDLNAYFPTTGRPPINMIFGSDKSLSMGECTIAKGIVLDSNKGTTSSTFVKIHEFSLSDNNAFDVLLEWSATCSSNCPEMYVVAPNGTTKYGLGFPSTTDLNVKTCNSGDSLNSKAYYLGKSTFDYLAVNSNVGNSKSGTWQVWARKSGSAIDYNLTVKRIRNDYFSSSTLTVLPWNNPISKIELAQVFIARFNENALWDPVADEYAYAEIGTDKKSGGNGSSIQPSSGLRPIGDQAFKSQLKNLSPVSVDSSAYGFAMSGDDMMNDILADQPSAEVRAEIIFGDANSYGTPNAVAAAQDAKDRNIVVFTVGFGRDHNFTDLKMISAITGGTFYNASDENALLSIFDTIAQRIFALSGYAYGIGIPDLNITIPVLAGSEINTPASNFQGTFELSSSSLRFFITDINILSPWYGSYNISFPCTMSCASEKKYLPEFGTNYSYTDTNGNYYANNFDINKYIDVNFLYRDLRLSFMNAELFDINHLTVTAQLSNVGDLNTLSYPSGMTDLNFSVNGSFAGTKTIQGLCGHLNPLCGLWFDLNSVELFREGEIEVSIDANKARDCPLGNSVKIICNSQLITQFYVVEFGVWEK